MKLPEGTVKSRINRGRTELAPRSRNFAAMIRAARCRTNRAHEGERIHERHNRTGRRRLGRTGAGNTHHTDPGRFASAVTDLLHAGHHDILVDLSPVTYADSATIGCLMDFIVRFAPSAGG